MFTPTFSCGQALSEFNPDTNPDEIIGVNVTFPQKRLYPEYMLLEEKIKLYLQADWKAVHSLSVSVENI